MWWILNWLIETHIIAARTRVLAKKRIRIIEIHLPEKSEPGLKGLKCHNSLMATDAKDNGALFDRRSRDLLGKVLVRSFREIENDIALVEYFTTQHLDRWHFMSPTSDENKIREGTNTLSNLIQTYVLRQQSPCFWMFLGSFVSLWSTLPFSFFAVFSPRVRHKPQNVWIILLSIYPPLFWLGIVLQTLFGLSVFRQPPAYTDGGHSLNYRSPDLPAFI